MSHIVQLPYRNYAEFKSLFEEAVNATRYNNQSILPHLRLEPDDRSPWQLWLDDDEDHGYTAEFYDTWDREFRQRHLFSCPVNDWYDQLASDFDININ